MESEVFKNELAAITVRVAQLETRFADMGKDFETLKTTVKHTDETAISAKLFAQEAAIKSAEAVVLLSAAKGISGFVAKHGPRVIAAAIGVAAYKGLIDTDLATKIGMIFAI